MRNPTRVKTGNPLKPAALTRPTAAMSPPTGHNVTVTIVNHEACSHVHIVVSDKTGFYNATNAHFDGYDHDDVSLEFADNYLYSYELKSICANFDDLCLEFGDIPAA